MRCKDCGTTLADSHAGPCPVCGNTRKMYEKPVGGTLGFRGSLGWSHVHEFWERRPLLLAVIITATAISPFIGFFVAQWPGVWIGLSVSIATSVGSFWAATKVREIHERHEP